MPMTSPELPTRREPSVLLTVATLVGLGLLACDGGARPAAPASSSPAAVASTAPPPAAPPSSPARPAPAAPAASAPPDDPRAEKLAAGDRFYDGCNWCEVKAKGRVSCTEKACVHLRLPEAAASAPAAPAAALAAAEQAAVSKAAGQVIQAIRARDGAALASLIDGRGAHLSPSPGFERDVNAMGPEEARTCFERPERRHWGTQDPSDTAVLETCAAHLEGYAKVMTAPGVKGTVNTSTLPHAQGMDAQVRRHFPGAATVDYLVPGQGQHADFNYQGVRLVFTKAADGWKLAGALHEYYLP